MEHYQGWTAVSLRVVERFALEIQRMDISVASAHSDGSDGYLGIPALMYRRLGALEPARVVICLHGRSASKSATFCQCARVASLGYTAVAIDLPGHGERPRFPPGLIGESQRLSTVSAAVSDVRAAADLLLTHQGVLPDRYALVGFSLGAVVALLTAVHDPRVAAVIAFMGVPLAHIDAIAAADVPSILFVCGTRDTAFPAESVERFYTSLRARRPDGDTALLTFEVGHYTTREIELKAFDWLRARLSPV